MSTVPAIPSRPIIFGEVLFDRFPDGREVLGGAPFNVAWHLRGFGLEPIFISRIGTDAGGEEVVARMQSWNMDTGGLQRDIEYPTGQVEVWMQAGQPCYNIPSHQAYDYIESGPALAAIGDCRQGPLYAGSLVNRAEVSRASLQCLRSSLRCPGFLDVNLRPGCWELAGVKQALAGAAWAKFNDEEVTVLADALDIAAGDTTGRAQQLRKLFDLELVVLTLGASGAVLLTASGCAEQAPGPVDTLVDTVGAGDAFAAVTLLGLIRGWPLQVTLARSLAFASRICGQRGATANDSELYAACRQDWGL